MALPQAVVVTDFHREVERRLAREDASLPSTSFSDGVRRSLYKYALIRNSWGTTNLDAGPITIERVLELYDAFAYGVTKGEKILPSEREVINYFALVDDLPLSPFALSVDDVQELHRHYFRDVGLDNRAKPGQWKQQDVVIDGPFGVVLTTPKSACVEALRQALEWLEGPGRELPLYVRTALFFHEFQLIHPFDDGNGRVGRLLALTILSSGGLASIKYCPIDDEINLNRHEYYSALSAADLGNFERWIAYFGAELQNGYARARALGARLQRIPPSVPDASRNLLEFLYVHRIARFNVRDIAAFYLGAHKNTITSRLRELQDLGLIAGVGRGRGRVYEVRALHEATTPSVGKPHEAKRDV